MKTRTEVIQEIIDYIQEIDNKELARLYCELFDDGIDYNYDETFTPWNEENK
jgi:hypothetical protein